MKLNTEHYYNRDLSWLRFNHRVLQEAQDLKNPLYERIKFLAIFSSNLDEFFKVRVSEIRQIKNLDKSLRKKLITKPNKLLKTIKKEVDSQQQEFGRIFKQQIIPELAEHDIHLIGYMDFSKDQQSFAEQYYQEQLKPHLSIFHSNEVKGNEFIQNEQLYLIGQNKAKNLDFIEIPTSTPRFVQIPAKNGFSITFVDDIIKNHFRLKNNLALFAIKISRDAELYIDNEYSGNLLLKIKASLPKRESGQVTRALVDENMAEELLTKLQKVLDVNDTDMVLGSVYHNFKDFFSFPNPTDHALSVADFTPAIHPELNKGQGIFDAVKERDRLLQFPYQSFKSILQWMKEAVQDDKVRVIKLSLYRISKTSELAKLLVKATEKGKEVFVFIETKARFDEENNIKWGERLEKAGATVQYSYPGIKVHSKILYFERIEGENMKRYAYISTGNFNEKTSKIYADYGLMTAHSKITKELRNVFKVIDKSLIIPKTKKLLVSPFNLRNEFEEMIKNEIENAKKGLPAYIYLKLNSLQDKAMVDLLYDANRAGVKVKLNVRGICTLVPGIQGQSEHISVISIVDRFLEHGRIYLFANGGKEKMYLGSADWMTRNLDHRIEVVTPILDSKVFEQLKKSMELQFADNVKARIVDKAQKNDYVTNNRPPLRSQQELAHLIKNDGVTKVK